MKRHLTRLMPLAGLLVMAAAAPAWAGAEDAIGTWRDTEKGSIVSVYKCGDGVCAKIIKTSNPGEKDVNNPNPALRNRPVAGLVIMSGGKKSGDNAWTGSLYNREDGQRYSGSLTVVSKNQLELKGCVAGGLICKSRIWTRAN